jgi:hypothetical protein
MSYNPNEISPRKRTLTSETSWKSIVLLHSLEVATCHRIDVKMSSLLETATNGEKLCQLRAANSPI